MTPARTYPYKAWALTDSFNVKEVELTESGSLYQERSSTGRLYETKDLYASKAEAIAAGREIIKKQRADQAYRLKMINTRAAALTRAEAAQPSQQEQGL